ncbi:MAG TPA: hypothetical protein VIK91_13590 [Nannocystis sp.]
MPCSPILPCLLLLALALSACAPWHAAARVMADNVDRFRARARPGETFLLIAHSGHLAAGAQFLPNGRRSPPSMGEHPAGAYDLVVVLPTATPLVPLEPHRA